MARAFLRAPKHWREFMLKKVRIIRPLCFEVRGKQRKGGGEEKYTVRTEVIFSSYEFFLSEEQCFLYWFRVLEWNVKM